MGIPLSLFASLAASPAEGEDLALLGGRTGECELPMGVSYREMPQFKVLL